MQSLGLLSAESRITRSLMVPQTASFAESVLRNQQVLNSLTTSVSETLMRSVTSSLADSFSLNQEILKGFTTPPVSEMLMRSISSSFAGSFQLNQEIFKGFSDTISRVLQSFIPDFGRIAEQIGTLFELPPGFRQWLDDFHEAIQLLNDRGWLVHPDSDLGMIRGVLSLKREKRLRQLDRFICEQYEGVRYSQMKKLMADWNEIPEFHSRRKILNAGFRAYKTRNYTAAVYTWLPHVEGVLTDYAIRCGYGRGAWKRFPEEYRASADDVRATVTEDFFGFFHSMYKADKLTWKPTRGDFPLRRDPILHGAELQVPVTRANAMRTFLMLEMLHYLIRECDSQRQAA